VTPTRLIVLWLVAVVAVFMFSSTVVSGRPVLPTDGQQDQPTGGQLFTQRGRCRAV